MEEAAKETVIIVHGTYAAPKPGVSRWYQPAEGVPATEFITKLNDALQKRGSAARCWAHCSQGDQGFHWSGKNNWVDRTRAAAELGNYVLNLRKEGWCCHIVAHSHGGNVVLEALPQIAAAPGKIVTLGTPFIDTMSPILQRIGRNQRFLTGLAAIVGGAIAISTAYAVWLWEFNYRVPLSGGQTVRDFMNRLMQTFGLVHVVEGIMIIFLVVVIGYTLFFFIRETRGAKPILNRAAQMQPKFLAIGSQMDEAWQLLHHMRTYPDPIAVKENLIRYLISSIRSHISQRHQVARIYGHKSYRDLDLTAKEYLALTHLLFVCAVSIVCIKAITEPTLWEMAKWLAMFVVGGALWLVILTFLVETTAIFSAFFSPFRWCAYRFGDVIGIGKAFVT